MPTTASTFCAIRSRAHCPAELASYLESHQTYSTCRPLMPPPALTACMYARTVSRSTDESTGPLMSKKPPMTIVPPSRHRCRRQQMLRRRHWSPRRPSPPRRRPRLHRWPLSRRQRCPRLAGCNTARPSRRRRRPPPLRRPSRRLLSVHGAQELSPIISPEAEVVASIEDIATLNALKPNPGWYSLVSRSRRTRRQKYPKLKFGSRVSGEFSRSADATCPWNAQPEVSATGSLGRRPAGGRGRP